jgi:hypothetical protein
VERCPLALRHLAPRYGGYCAGAVSNNYTAEVDATAGAVRDGKLYLNFNKNVQKQWLEDVDARIDAADVNRPNLHR